MPTIAPLRGNSIPVGVTPRIFKKAIAPQAPQEFCPVQLFWLAAGKFDWDIHQYAEAFGWKSSTIQKWIYGVQVPSRQAKIVAYFLKVEWKL